jgi:signal transduction histidine kinase
MKGLGGYALGVFAALVLLMGVAVLGAPSYRDEVRIEELIERLHTEDRALELEVLRVRARLSRHYDPLNQHLETMAASLRGIEALLGGLSGDRVRQLESHTRAIRAFIKHRSLLVERFKTANALARNSADYVGGQTPRLVSLLAGRGQMQIAVQVQSLNGELDEAVRTSDLARLDGLAGMVAELRGHEAVPTGLYSVWLRQIDLARQHSTTLVGLLRELANQDGTPLITALEQAYDAERVRISRRDEQLRWMLYLTSLALLAYLLYLFLILRNTARCLDRSHSEVLLEVAQRRCVEDDLRVLNEELEQRVAERSRDLKAANQELEAFSYSVSHDLRAPLRAIDGYGQALVEDYASALGPDALRTIERMRQATQRMGGLIEDLLRLSRINRAELAPARVDLSTYAQEQARTLGETEPERHVEWAIQPEVHAQADAGLLRVVMQNLLNNAWKFTRNTPAARIEFGARRAGKVLECWVRDNGVGFDPCYGDKLFQPFQRLHHDSEFEGTGIGLATVARAITRLGGKVRAEGAVGQGATVYFTLPGSTDAVAGDA